MRVTRSNIVKFQPKSPEVINDESFIKKAKRVVTACDQCRIKKTKCNGAKPCQRCIHDGKICVYTPRKAPTTNASTGKQYPEGYVELIEKRLELVTQSLLKLVDVVNNDESTDFIKNCGGDINRIVEHLADSKDNSSVSSYTYSESENSSVDYNFSNELDINHHHEMTTLPQFDVFEEFKLGVEDFTMTNDFGI